MFEQSFCCKNALDAGLAWGPGAYRELLPLYIYHCVSQEKGR